MSSHDDIILLRVHKGLYVFNWIQVKKYHQTIFIFIKYLEGPAKMQNFLIKVVFVSFLGRDDLAVSHVSVCKWL